MTDPGQRDGLRASDADREKVIERLREAHGEGRLDLAEFDERAGAAWAARTYGELAPLTADLPGATVALPAEPAPRPAAGSQTPGRQPAEPRPSERRGPDRPGRAAVATWLTVSLINFVIWGVISLSTLDWIYPWWIWVAGPWGAVLLAGWIGSRVARS